MASRKTLCSLPEELVSGICTHLSQKDLRQFRQTCKDLCNKSDHQFVTKHFGELYVLFTLDGIKSITNIAENERIGSQIRKLKLCLFAFPDDWKTRIQGQALTDTEKGEIEASIQKLKLDGASKEDIETARTRTIREHEKNLKRARRRTYGRMKSAYFTAVKQSHDLDLLNEALSKLPALNSIQLVDRMVDNDPPWGAKTLRSKIGIWPTNEIPRQDLVEEKIEYRKRSGSHAIALIFSAIIQHKVQLKAFTIEDLPYDLRLPEHPTSRRIRTASTPAKTFNVEQIPKLGPIFSNIKELHLQAQDYAPNHLNVRSLGLGDSNYLFHWLSQYTYLWSSVQRLTIAPDRQTHTSRLRHYMYNGTAVFPRLRHLIMQNLSVHIDDMVEFIRKRFETLESVETLNVALIGAGNTYYHMLKAMYHSPALLKVDIQNDDQYFYLDSRDPFRRQFTFALGGTRHLLISENTPEAFQDVLMRYCEDVAISLE